MLNRIGEGPIETLEPLIEAVRRGVEGAGWELSGQQKTTSHHFEGRWEGDSTRSAYLFFHRTDGPDAISVDVFLDETSRGLTGNLALVVELRSLTELGDVPSTLGRLADLATGSLPEGHRHPLTLRFRLGDASRPVEAAEATVRFKLAIPRAVIATGPGATTDLSGRTVTAFQAILNDAGLRAMMLPDE